MWDTYDQWKTRTPEDDWYCVKEEPNGWSVFYCDACCDIGWLEGPGDTVIPCTECSDDVSLDDLDEPAHV